MADEAATGWTSAFAAKSEQSFGQTFADDVILEASVLVEPITGRTAVQATMAAASKIYDALSFTRSAAGDNRAYLEWEASAFGIDMRGITILTRDGEGNIQHAAIHHRPLGAALTFSAELGRRLDGVVDRRHFHTERPA